MSKTLKRIFGSELLEGCSKTQRIAYVAVMTALAVVCNMFFEFKLADTQFSLTIFFSAMCGIIIGPIFGFVSAMLGDLVGFLYNSGGFVYYPWIGISMGVIAFVAGFIVNLFPFNFKGVIYLKLFFVSIFTFIICTVGINTTFFWLMYNKKSVPFFAYLNARLFVQGQVWNSVVNYALMFVLYPIIIKIKEILLKSKRNSN